jgi:hypothetical protein
MAHWFVVRRSCPAPQTLEDDCCGVRCPQRKKTSALQVAAGIPDATALPRGIYLTGKYRLLAAANFEFVPIRVFEKEGVVTRTVALANFRPLKLFPAGLAHDLCNPIHFFPRIGPERDARAIRFVAFIRTKAKEFRRFVAAGGKKSMEGSPGLFVNESKLWQKFPVKLFRRFHVSHPQIDVIEATRFHVLILNLVA